MAPFRKKKQTSTPFILRFNILQHSILKYLLYRNLHFYFFLFAKKNQVSHYQTINSKHISRNTFQTKITMLSVVKLLPYSFTKRSCSGMEGEVLQSCLKHLVNQLIHNSGVSLLVLGLVSGQGPTERKEGESKKGWTESENASIF